MAKTRTLTETRCLDSYHTSLPAVHVPKARARTCTRAFLEQGRVLVFDGQNWGTLCADFNALHRSHHKGYYTWTQAGWVGPGIPTIASGGAQSGIWNVPRGSWRSNGGMASVICQQLGLGQNGLLYPSPGTDSEGPVILGVCRSHTSMHAYIALYTW